jgi:hypothetical protein
MATYKSNYTGPQIDQAVSHAVNMDVNPTAGHTDRVVSSGGVKSALGGLTMKFYYQVSFTFNNSANASVPISTVDGSLSTARILVGMVDSQGTPVLVGINGSKTNLWAYLPGGPQTATMNINILAFY